MYSSLGNGFTRTLVLRCMAQETSTRSFSLDIRQAERSSRPTYIPPVRTLPDSTDSQVTPSYPREIPSFPL